MYIPSFVQLLWRWAFFFSGEAAAVATTGVVDVVAAAAAEAVAAAAVAVVVVVVVVDVRGDCTCLIAMLFSLSATIKEKSWLKGRVE